MKRLHVHVAVDNLAQSIGFYTTLFAAPPIVEKPDYAKWALDDPRVNFAISARGREPGLDHLGIQVDSDAELEEINGRLVQAALPSVEESGGACCYARSDKYWAVDPQGIAWEAFHTLDSVPTFNGKPETAESAAGDSCCVPKPVSKSGCC